tara:strand:+ start:3120 stop:3485 length:366 start_codon:yes stop_codon:yes gene_type:complete
MKIFNYIIILIFLFSTLIASDNSKLSLEIYKNIRCLVCQGQSIADSNSDFAQTIKLVVQDQINEGKNKKEIYEFLVDKYGEWIIYRPAVDSKNLLLWFLPYLSLFFGAIIILILVKKRDKL